MMSLCKDVDPPYYRGGATSLHAPKNHNFGTCTNPGNLATVRMLTLLIRIAWGFSPAPLLLGPG